MRFSTLSLLFALIVPSALAQGDSYPVASAFYGGPGVGGDSYPTVPQAQSRVGTIAQSTVATGGFRPDRRAFGYHGMMRRNFGAGRAKLYARKLAPPKTRRSLIYITPPGELSRS